MASKQEYKDIKERIVSECRIIDWVGQIGLTLIKKGSTYGTKEYNGCAIYDATNSYATFSNGKTTGGNVIDFLVEYGNMTNEQAFKTLVDSLGGFHRLSNTHYVPKPKPKPQPKKPFVLPDKGKGIQNVTAYLTKSRKIAPKIVKTLIERKMIYQDTRKNCVFVGYDKDGKAVFGCKRSSNTYTKYVGDVSGNNYKVGWYVDNKAKSLVIAESPVDIMSIMTIMEKKGKKINDYNYLALSGVSKQEAVFHHIKEDGITKIINGMDKDEAGIKASWQLEERLSKEHPNCEYTRFLSKNKDFNDDLVKGVPKDLNIAQEVKDEIISERYCNPYVADMIKKLKIPIGKVIENKQKGEAWWVPLKKETNLVKEFQRGVVPVIHPGYSTNEKIKEIVKVFDAIYNVGIHTEMNQRLDVAKSVPSLNDVKKVAISIEKKKNSIMGKLQQYERGDVAEKKICGKNKTR